MSIEKPSLIESPPAPEKVEVKPEELLDDEREMLRQEVAEKIEQEENPDKKSKMGRRLTVVVMASLIAFGATKEAAAGLEITKSKESGKKERVLTKEEIAASEEKKRELDEKWERARKAIEEMKSPEKIESMKREYQGNYEKMKEIVDREDIKEKVSWLKGRFGGAMGNFLSIHWIERDLKSLDEIEQGKDNPDIFVARDYPLAMTPGSKISNAYQERWTEKNVELRDIQIRNLELIPDLSEREFREVILSKYGRRYLESSISEVVFVPEVRILAHDQKIAKIILGAVDTFGLNRYLKEDLRADIKIYDLPEGMTKDEFIDVFLHEINHSNDWNDNFDLTSAERINMLYEFANRFDQEDRFRSDYIEGINEKGIKDRLGRDELSEDISPGDFIKYIKVVEYWAELGREYIKNPDGLRQNHPKDHELTEKWMKRLSGSE